MTDVNTILSHPKFSYRDKPKNFPLTELGDAELLMLYLMLSSPDVTKVELLNYYSYKPDITVEFNTGQADLYIEAKTIAECIRGAVGGVL